MSDVISPAHAAVLSDLSANLRRLRKEQAVTPADVASAADMSESSISNLESPTPYPTTTRTLAALADALGCSIYELVRPWSREGEYEVVGVRCKETGSGVYATLRDPDGSDWTVSLDFVPKLRSKIRARATEEIVWQEVAE